METRYNDWNHPDTKKAAPLAPPFSNAVGYVSVKQEPDTQRALEYVSNGGVADVVWRRVVDVIRAGTVRPVLVVNQTIQCAERQLANEFTCNFSTRCFC
jgi:hypothetical protein